MTNRIRRVNRESKRLEGRKFSQLISIEKMYLRKMVLETSTLHRGLKYENDVLRPIEPDIFGSVEKIMGEIPK